MTRRAHRFAALAAACLALAAFAAPAAACSCVAPGPPQQEMEKADAVFSGRVAASEPAEPRDEVRFPRMRVTLELDRVWKGCEEGDEVVLWTAADSAACGYEFETGERYLVYAYAADDGSLTTSLCSRTRPLGRAEEDLEAFGEPRRTVEPAGGE
jgi:hypothetical protein